MSRRSWALRSSGVLLASVAIWALLHSRQLDRAEADTRSAGFDATLPPLATRNATDLRPNPATRHQTPRAETPTSSEIAPALLDRAIEIRVVREDAVAVSGARAYALQSLHRYLAFPDRNDE